MAFCLESEFEIRILTYSCRMFRIKIFTYSFGYQIYTDLQTSNVQIKIHFQKFIILIFRLSAFTDIDK